MTALTDAEREQAAREQVLAQVEALADEFEQRYGDNSLDCEIVDLRALAASIREGAEQ